jgi:hypothetical protein
MPTSTQWLLQSWYSPVYLLVVSLIISACMGLGHSGVSSSELMGRTDFSHLITFLGISAYSIEGINLLFTLRRDFIKHRPIRQFKIMYYSCYFGVLALYIFFGMINYLKFGMDTKRIIFFNFGTSNMYIFVLQILYATVDSLGPVPRQPAQPVPGLQHNLLIGVLQELKASQCKLTRSGPTTS